MVTNNKMHPCICRESNSSGNQRYKLQSRIQSKAKTQRVSTRMHRAKVAQSCAAQKVANPPKRKVSEQSKDAAREQQNAPRKCSNEDVATKKQGRSRYAREDPPKSPQKRYCECRLCLVGFLRRRATSVQHDALQACNRHAIVCKGALRRARINLLRPRCSFPWHHDALFRGNFCLSATMFFSVC
jgi:hypothetical protein